MGLPQNPRPVGRHKCLAFKSSKRGKTMSDKPPADSQGRIILFGAKQIRRAWVDEQWYFSVVDIVGALTDNDAPSKYWTAMKRREEKSTGFQLSTLCRQLKLTSADGKSYTTEAVNTEAAFRIIQSI